MGADNTSLRTAMQHAALGEQSSESYRGSAAARCAEYVALFDAEVVDETEQVFGIADKGAGERGTALGKSGAGQIDRVNRIMLRKTLDDEAPGKRVAHEAVDYEQRRAAASMEIAPADAVDDGGAVFNAGDFGDCGYHARRRGSVMALPGIIVRLLQSGWKRCVRRTRSPRTCRKLPATLGRFRRPWRKPLPRRE